MKILAFFLVFFLFAVSANALTLEEEILGALTSLQNRGSVAVIAGSANEPIVVVGNDSLVHSLTNVFQNNPVFVENGQFNMIGRGVRATPQLLSHPRGLGDAEIVRLAQTRLDVGRLSYEIPRQQIYVNRLEDAVALAEQTGSQQQLTNLTRELVSQQQKLGSLKAQMDSHTQFLNELLARPKLDARVLERLRQAQEGVRGVPPGSGGEAVAVQELQTATSEATRAASRDRLAAETLETATRADQAALEAKLAQDVAEAESGWNARVKQVDEARASATGATEQGVPGQIRSGEVTPATIEATGGGQPPGGGPVQPSGGTTVTPGGTQSAEALAREQRIAQNFAALRQKLNEQLDFATARNQPEEIARIQNELKGLELEEKAWRANRLVLQQEEAERIFRANSAPEDVATSRTWQAEAERLRLQAIEARAQAEAAKTELANFRNPRPTTPSVVPKEGTKPAPSGGGPEVPPKKVPTATEGAAAEAAGTKATAVEPAPKGATPAAEAKTAEKATAKAAKEAAAVESKAAKTAGVWGKTKTVFKTAAKLAGWVFLINELIQIGVDVYVAYSAPDDYKTPYIFSDLPSDAGNATRYELEIQPHPLFGSSFKTKYFVFPFEQENVLYDQKYLEDFLKQSRVLEFLHSMAFTGQMDELVRELSPQNLLQSVSLELYRKNPSGDWEPIQSVECTVADKKISCPTDSFGALENGDYRLFVLVKLYGPIWNHVIEKGEQNLNRNNCSYAGFAIPLSEAELKKVHTEYCPFFRLATIPSDSDLTNLISEAEEEVFKENDYFEIPKKVFEEFAARTEKAFNELPNTGNIRDAWAAGKTTGWTLLDGIGAVMKAAVSPASVFQTRRKLVGQFDLFQSNLLSARQMAFGMPIIADFAVGSETGIEPIGSAEKPPIEAPVVPAAVSLSLELLDYAGTALPAENLQSSSQAVQIRFSNLDLSKDLYVNASGIPCSETADSLNKGSAAALPLAQEIVDSKAIYTVPAVELNRLVSWKIASLDGKALASARGTRTTLVACQFEKNSSNQLVPSREAKLDLVFGKVECTNLLDCLVAVNTNFVRIFSGQ